MGKIVEKKKKKKGRPSLLDLQKRNLKEQQQQQQQNQQKRNNNSAPHSNDNYRSAPGSAAAPTAVRRSTRRNPNPDCESPEKALTEDEEDEDEDELAGKRREKKLKLVLRLPQNQKSSLNYASLNSGGSDSNAEEDNATLNSHKKRKINAIGDGSGQQGSHKGDKSISGKNLSKTFQGTTKSDSGPSTPLPDKKLLLFILDRLQKKDTYGVFSEPVDPEELPDYHEVIEHPMDFSTVRKKLASGAYANLEQFEKDVFLICTNAMQYNALDTIYFRQARSIQELAKKNFENLRQDSDDNEPEQKVVRRGRPPTKNLKKPVGRPSLEHAASEFSSDATLATGGENATLLNHDVRKGSLLLDKSSLADSSGRLNGLRNNDLYSSWLADNKFERNDEFTGSGMRGNLKHGKKQSVLDDNRRNTYRQSYSSVAGREPSVLTTFEVERKQLMPIGVLVELGYARSLARFAANLGPAAWKIAAKKIERSLPSGVKFGPGWVGENDVTQHRTLLFPLHLPGQTSESLPVTTVSNSLSVATGHAVDPKVDNLSEKPEGDDLSNKNVPYNTASAAAASTTSSTTTTTTTTTATTSDGHTSKSLLMSVSTSSASPLATRAPELITVKAESIEGLKPHAGFNILNSGNVGGTRPKSPFPIQGPMIHSGMNGFNGFNLATQMGKLPGSPRPAVFNMQSAQIHDRTNSTNIHPATANSMNSEETKFLENRSTLNSESSLPNSRNVAPAAPVPLPGFHPRPSWQGLSPQPRPDSGLSRQQKPDSVPPDLNIRFQSPGSPSPSRVDSTQPDLALQL